MMQFNTSELEMVLGFSSALYLASFCGADVNFIEMNSQELFENLCAKETSLGFDFNDEGEVYQPDQMRDLLQKVKNDFMKERAQKMEFALADSSNVFISSFQNLIAEFNPNPKLHLVSNESGDQIIAISEADVTRHLGLMAQLHDLTRRQENISQVSLLVYKNISDLGDDFNKFAVEIKPYFQTYADKPPILRY